MFKDFNKKWYMIGFITGMTVANLGQLLAHEITWADVLSLKRRIKNRFHPSN